MSKIKKSLFVRMFLKGAECFYTQISQKRHWFYATELFTSYKAPIPVLSVGNISFGGTGKTPFVIWLCERLKKNNKSMALISKSYGGSVTSPTRVEVTNPEGAIEYGDEPFLLSQQLPQVDVYVGPQKYKVAKHISEVSGKTYDFLILDDGFQHWQLQRQIDIVLVDVSAGPKILKRESWKSLMRAHVIVLTKINFATVDQIHLIQKKIPSNKIVLEVAYESVLTPWILNGVGSVDSLRVLSRDLSGKKVFSFCGLANPDVFFQMIQNLKPLKLERQIFKDHYPYSQIDFMEMDQKIFLNSYDIVIVTLKDLVKLRPFLEMQFRGELPGESFKKFYYLDLSLVVTGPLDSFDKVIYEKCI